MIQQPPLPPQATFAVPYQPYTGNSGRILRTLGLCTLIFGAASAFLGATGFMGYMKGPSPAAGQQILLVATTMRGLFGVLLAVAGILLLQESSVYSLVLVGSIGSIVAGFAESTAYIVRYMTLTGASASNPVALFLANRLAYSVVYAVFPLALMLVLPACRDAEASSVR